MKMTVEKVKKFKCPVCQRAMEYQLPIDMDTYREGTVQTFICEFCGLTYTIWGLRVTNLQKEYDKINAERRRYDEKAKSK